MLFCTAESRCYLLADEDIGKQFWCEGDDSLIKLSAMPLVVHDAFERYGLLLAKLFADTQ